MNKKTNKTHVNKKCFRTVLVRSPEIHCNLPRSRRFASLAVLLHRNCPCDRADSPIDIVDAVLQLFSFPYQHCKIDTSHWPLKIPHTLHQLFRSKPGSTIITNPTFKLVKELHFFINLTGFS